MKERKHKATRERVDQLLSDGFEITRNPLLIKRGTRKFTVLENGVISEVK